MPTFSQMVDQVASESKRFDMITEIAGYLNQAIREVHFEPSRGSAVHFHDNYNEARITADVEEGFAWDIPNPRTFQGGITARYDSQIDQQGRPAYAVGLTPGPRVEQECHVYQRTGNAVVFKGYGGIGGIISLSWFEYPPALKYHPVESRPASYDVEDGWTYLAASPTPEEMVAAQGRVSNWLIERWEPVLIEGLRAKLYKRLADETRQRTAYSLYVQLRGGLYTSEISQTFGVN